MTNAGEPGGMSAATSAPPEDETQVAVTGSATGSAGGGGTRRRVAALRSAVRGSVAALSPEVRRSRPSATALRSAVRRPKPSAVAFWALVRRHRPFAAALAAGAVLRAIAVLGYRPASWFNDSFDYLHVAMAPYPHPIRPDGYSFLLWILRPFHSFTLVVTIQHLMGLSGAIMIYALLRKRFGLPGWGATPATVPLLFNGYQIQLEHLILSDTMFGFLLISIVTLLLWHGRNLTWKQGAAVGALLGLATLTRTVGTPVLLAVVVYFLIIRINWRVLAATVALCTLPLAAYAGWFWSWYGKPGMTMSSGVFLYARVTAFADCNKIKLPVPEYALCIDKKTSHTPLVFSQDAIWNRNSPFHRIPTDRFTDYQNQLAGDFAKRAIMAQPLDYAQVVAKDFFFTFRWNRTVFPDRATFDMYKFGKKSAALPNWRMSRDRTAASEAQAYEGGNARTDIVDPYATVIRTYQRFVALPGTLLGGILLTGLAGMVALWRRWGGAAFLPWIVATGLLLVPPATAEFDYRYVLPTVPLACLAAALAFTAEPRDKFRRVFRRRRVVAEEPVRDPVAI